MCQSKAHGGRRCTLSKERRDRRNAKRRNQYATEKFVANQTETHEKWISEADEAIKQFNHDSTPEGIKALTEQVAALDKDDVSAVALELKKRQRQVVWSQQFQASRDKEEANGRQNDLSDLYQKLPAASEFDDAQFDSVVNNVRYYKERMAARMTRAEKDFLKATSDQKWNDHLDGLQKQLEDNDAFDEDAQKIMERLRNNPETPDTISFSTYTAISDAIGKAHVEKEGQLKTVADYTGASVETVNKYYEGYRKQYQEIEANNPENVPDVPFHWVAGRFQDSGMVKQKNSSFAPSDPASMYAIYRMRADENAIPASQRQVRNIASIDLETAAAKGNSAAAVDNGRIIEVGIVEYTPDGKEVGRYSQLVRPETEFLEKNGTGAQDIHNIAPSDLDGQPTWDEVKNDVMKNLEGKILLAQNADFEKRWLTGKLENFEKENLPVVDTLEMSRKHLEMPTYKLGNICAELKVPYTDGHRATHDAEVTGDAFFALKKLIRDEWNSSPARKNAPILSL